MFDSYSNTGTLSLDPEACNGCGTCMEVCPHAVFENGGGTARLSRPEDCIECGACSLNCPEGAIKVDSGVGCATAMIVAALTGRKETSCGCGGAATPCC